MDVMYNYSKAKIKSSLEIDKIMKKKDTSKDDDDFFDEFFE